MSDTERKSWVCIRCGKVNAPHIDQCTCVDDLESATATQIDDLSATNADDAIQKAKKDRELYEKVLEMMRQREREREDYEPPYRFPFPRIVPLVPNDDDLYPWVNPRARYGRPLWYAGSRKQTIVGAGIRIDAG